MRETAAGGPRGGGVLRRATRSFSLAARRGGTRHGALLQGAVSRAAGAGAAVDRPPARRGRVRTGPPRLPARRRPVPPPRPAVAETPGGRAPAAHPVGAGAARQLPGLPVAFARRVRRAGLSGRRAAPVRPVPVRRAVRRACAAGHSPRGGLAARVAEPAGAAAGARGQSRGRALACRHRADRGARGLAGRGRRHSPRQRSSRRPSAARSEARRGPVRLPRRHAAEEGGRGAGRCLRRSIVAAPDDSRVSRSGSRRGLPARPSRTARPAWNSTRRAAPPSSRASTSRSCRRSASTPSRRRSSRRLRKGGRSSRAASAAFRR